MEALRPVTIDFESFGIDKRPAYPPIPVGVAIKYPGQRGVYHAWGHPQGNNCSWNQGQDLLGAAYKAGLKGDGLLFQAAKFDLDIADTHMGLAVPDWRYIHDTMLLLFLDDPHQKELGLKPSADRLLGMPPEEQDAVKEWLLKHQPLKAQGIKISGGSKASKGKKGESHNFGKYIAYAPGNIVGKYAMGDVDRTEKLFKLLHPKTIKRGMGKAYERERRLLPILLDIERHGVRVDLKRLSKDLVSYNAHHNALTAWVQKHLKAPGLELDSGAKLVAAMLKAKKLDPSKLGKTETGKDKSDKESLLEAVTDKTLLAVLKYRTQLGTCLSTFMGPWALMARKSGGVIYTTWNQVKGDGKGARTGRLSSTPNFQNIPKTFKPIFRHELKGSKLPACPIGPLPALPLVRSYVVPFALDHILLDRDYSQQELRILAHYEGGELLEAYIKDVWMDVHEYVRQLVNQMTGKSFERTPIKNTNFGIIYGMGIALLALKSEISYDLAKEIRAAIKAVFPGLKMLSSTMERRAASRQPIRTWGGREYYCEPAAIINGKMVTFEYKMLNVLIQGSAADCTKEAIIRYYAIKHPDVKLLLNVHDQITISAPKRLAKLAMAQLKEAMESVVFNIPMLSEGKQSVKNWAELKPYDKKGVITWRG